MARIDGIGFEIHDDKRSRKYIQVTYDTKQDAEYERELLLKGFPETSPWRKRLVVKRVGPKY